MHPRLKGILVASAALCLAMPSLAAEKKITRAELPFAVGVTADQQSKGATVKGYSTDDEGGTLEYEVEMVVNGDSRDVSIAPDGRLLEVEEQVALRGLSADVQAGLHKKAGKGDITKVESITKQGKLVAYEAQVRTAGKHSEVQVGPKGETPNHEE